MNIIAFTGVKTDHYRSNLEKRRQREISFEIKRLPNENERQYIWRLANAKESGLIDLSWDDLAAIFNREFREDEASYYGESAYRKPFLCAKKYYEDVFLQQESDDFVEELQFQKRELEKERKKLQTEKIEYNKWLREEARDEMIADRIENAIYALPPLTNPFKGGAKPSDNTSKAWILAFGDAHFGAEFEIRGVYSEIINAYNPEIFYDRMNNLFAQTLHIIEKEGITDLYVFDLGDQIDGILRVSQLMKLRFGVVESAIKYADFLANWLNALTEHVNVYFRQCAGNHSELRLINNKKNTFEDENMAAVIYQFLKVRLADNPRFNIDQNPTGMIFETLAGNNILAFHGEAKDMEAALKDFVQIYGIDIDILIAGHLHHAFSETVGVNTDVMRTPSIIGIDDYSLKLHKTSNPGATLFQIEDGAGKTMEYHIKL